MNATALQEFKTYLAQTHTAFQEQNGHLIISQNQGTLTGECIIHDNGRYEAAVADFINTTFPFRRSGEWTDAEQLKQLLQQMQSHL